MHESDNNLCYLEGKKIYYKNKNNMLFGNNFINNRKLTLGS